MDRGEQKRLIRQALAAIDNGRPPLAFSFTRNDPAIYVSPERAACEDEILFRRYPIVAGFSSELRAPGDFITDALAPVPLLVVRGESGALRAFANICRHRGARVVAGCGRGASRFVCPYHAWSYDTEGALRAIPDEFGFAGLERASRSLIALPAEERFGMIWVTFSDAAPIPATAHLGGLGADLESYRVDSFEPRERRVLRRRMNWKLVSDTFWEAYHIKPLHRATVAPLFVRNLALFDAFGLCHRLAGIRNSIEELRAVAEERWDLLPHATILMNLFPNTILVMQTDHMEVYRVFPVPGRPGESVTEVIVLAPPGGGAEAERKWKKVGDLLVGVIEQDFEIGESIQRNFESGAMREVLYGRFEAALEHFHSSIRSALERAVSVGAPAGPFA